MANSIQDNRLGHSRLSALPNHVFNAIGITVDLQGLPQGNAIFSVSERRRMSIKASILHYLSESRITPSEAGSLWGQYETCEKVSSETTLTD